MRTFQLLIGLAALVALPFVADARGGGGSHGGGHGGGHSGSHGEGSKGGHSAPHVKGPGSSGNHSEGGPKTKSVPKPQAPKHDPKADQLTKAKPPHPNANRCEGCPRDNRGKIQRSEATKRDFMRQTGYPNGRPGYVVDHIIPLSKGGKDVPSNMQWQTTAEARAKDRVERK